MIVTRFAPSPTGYIHVGNLRTALMNYLVARKGNGTFILRIDDTDPERSDEKYVDAIKEDMDWLGLHWDRIERQSQRLGRYADAADRLRGAKRLYEAFETPAELDLKRRKQLNMGRPPVYDRAALQLSNEERAALRGRRGNGVWRFLLDQTRIEWSDGILGDVSIDAASVSDPVLIRGDGQVLYTLASVVDDIEMGVTNVVRGLDHTTNTATQIQIIQTLGGNAPRFAHHSLLTGPTGEPLAKRLGTLALRELREQGVQPMALLSLMARLGSSDPVELRTDMNELIHGFDLAFFGSAPTKFNSADLAHLTSRHLRRLPLEAVRREVAGVGVPDGIAGSFWLMVRDNIETLKDLEDWWRLCRDGAEPIVCEKDREFVAQAMALLPESPFDETTWSVWTDTVRKVTGRKGRKLFMPLRRALTGTDRGPEMARLLPLLQVIPARKIACGQSG